MKSIQSGSSLAKHVVEALTPPNRRHSGAFSGDCELCEGPCKLKLPLNGPKPKRPGVLKKALFKKAAKIKAATKRRLAFNESFEPAQKIFRSSYFTARHQIRQLGEGIFCLR
jgi:hypothetical protein